jgi:hypothetical protein
VSTLSPSQKAACGVEEDPTYDLTALYSGNMNIKIDLLFLSALFVGSSDI